MKVYELIHELSSCPAGSEVVIPAEEGNEPLDITYVEDMGDVVLLEHNGFALQKDPTKNKKK